MNYCTNCGRKVIENASFCGACGKTIEKKKQSTSQKPKKEPQVVYVEEKKIEPLVSINVILTALFAIVLISILFIFSISAITRNREVNTLNGNSLISFRF